MKRNLRHFYSDKTIVLSKIKEAFSSVLPIIFIVILLGITITPISAGSFLAFLLGSVAVIVGMGLFSLGADIAMTPIGSYVGSSIIKTKKLWLIIPLYFIIGVGITVSEPDLMVLAGQLADTIGIWVLIITIGVGVGVFLVIAFIRIILKIKLHYILLFFYAVVFILAFFVPKNFLPLAFDSGGVTTGPMSVPFIISIGMGITSMVSDSKDESDCFGVTALCSIGPILSVMILGIIFNPEHVSVSENVVPEISNSKALIENFFSGVPHTLKEVGIALLPILLIFLISLTFGERISKVGVVKILIGVVYTYIGLVLFLRGVNFGFLPIGSEIGKTVVSSNMPWIIVPIGMLIGFFVVAAEPAVHILNKQVYEATEGAIPKKMLSVSLMIGTAVSVGLAMLRIILHINIMYFLVPGYVIALVLTFFVPDFFTAIAFDSGGVASGAMATGFIMPLALGVASGMGGNIAMEGFGVVAFVAMTPLITIQIMGLYYKLKLKKANKDNEEQTSAHEEIIG